MLIGIIRQAKKALSGELHNISICCYTDVEYGLAFYTDWWVGIQDNITDRSKHY